MPLAPAADHAWQFVPPLEMPLALRLENGRFGALRPKPAGPGVINQIHEAVDLAASVGDAVFAAYSGRVVAVETNPALTRGNVMIDHHAESLGFLTKYDHVTDITVAPGDFVQKGAPFAAVSAEPAEPHLHFELWAAVDRPAVSDNDRVPVDPTRLLYAWERRTAPDAELADGALAPQSVGVAALHNVPFFTATFEADATTVLHVPMYEPMTADERLLIDLLRDAHARDVDVTVRSRASSFWGVDVVTQVQLSP